MKRVMHKAARPKADHMNPTWCVARLSPEDAHRFSTVRWSGVTCRACLRKRKQRRPW